MTRVHEDIIEANLENRLIGFEKNQSPFEEEARHIAIPICHVFRKKDGIGAASFERGNSLLPIHSPHLLSKTFPTLSHNQKGFILEPRPGLKAIQGKRVAVLFSGGPAPGGHNVLAGIKDVLGKQNTLLGVRMGPKGLLTGNLFEISESDIDSIRNMGGFDFLGTDRTKIKSQSQFDHVKDCVQRHHLNAIIIIGGDDSNTNAAFLAESLVSENCAVIGVPKTIDGDLQIGSHLPISFGFDTATKIYSEMVGNILKDSPSSKKYWHFIKLMGRNASHVTLEVALQTRPTLAFISEEVAEKNQSLHDIVNYIAEVIAYRAGKGLKYGTVVIPEGLIEFIPEFKLLIAELNEKLGQYKTELIAIPSSKMETFLLPKLTYHTADILRSLPSSIKEKLIQDRDSHGNLQVSHIPTEKLLMEMAQNRLRELKHSPIPIIKTQEFHLTEEEWKTFQSYKFIPLSHFFGYEGRCGAPSRFDSAYAYNLGLTAGSLALNGQTGYMASVSNFENGGKPLAIPLTALMNEEKRDGIDTLVIKKALVKLQSPAFHFFAKRREEWAKQDNFTSPGPIQMWGPLSHQVPYTVALNQHFKGLDFCFE